MLRSAAVREASAAATSTLLRLVCDTAALRSNQTPPHVFAALDGIPELTFISSMTVTPTAEQEQFIAEQLKDGHYRSASDVIAQSLGMLRAQEEFIRSNAAELREKIAVGIEQANRGELLDGKEVFRNLRKKLQSR
jgi:antitoxin ParD1/3/4